MDLAGDLAELLAGDLAACGYGREERIDGVECAAVLSSARPGPGRFVCAIAEVPERVRDPGGVGRFVQDIRRGLSKRYVPFPWPKRLGTFTVLLVGRELFEELGGQEARLVDDGGLHVNVMLGTVLVDVETFRARSDYTWGLLGDGEHFRRIQDAVETWCRGHRRADRSVWNKRLAVSVA
jgi:hypothetical protein